MKLCTAFSLIAVFIAAPSLAQDGASQGVASVAQLPAGKYSVEQDHAYIAFQYSHLGFSNPILSFKSFDGFIDLDPQAPEKSQVSISIDAASIDSSVSDFDDHLRSADFFDTDSFPTLEFVSTSASLSAANEGQLTGNLTIKGKTHPVTLDVTLNNAGVHPISDANTIGISASGAILRSEFGLGEYIPMVSDEVVLHIELEFVLIE